MDNRMKSKTNFTLAVPLSETVAFLFMKESLTTPEGLEDEGVEPSPETRRCALMKIVSGTVALLMTDVLRENAQAKINTDIRTDFIATVEINSFGEPGSVRHAILYRDDDGSIVDWRWYSDPKQIPQPLGDGRNIAVWEDQGMSRTVLCWTVRFTRTRDDRELTERAFLPEHKRRKLSQK